MMISRVWSKVFFLLPELLSACWHLCATSHVFLHGTKCTLLLMLAMHLGVHWMLENPLASIVVASSIVTGDTCMYKVCAKDLMARSTCC